MKTEKEIKEMLSKLQEHRRLKEQEVWDMMASIEVQISGLQIEALKWVLEERGDYPVLTALEKKE